MVTINNETLQLTCEHGCPPFPAVQTKRPPKELPLTMIEYFAKPAAKCTKGRRAGLKITLNEVVLCMYVDIHVPS